MNDSKTFWNSGYKQGVKYRQLGDEEMSFLLGALPPGAKTVLDIGCGTGDLVRQLSAAGLGAYGVDIADEAIKKAQAASGSSADR